MCTRCRNDESDICVGELNNIEMADILGKTFTVAVSTGSRLEPTILSSTVKKNLTFLTAADEIIGICRSGLHGKMFVEDGEAVSGMLCPCAIDYIEANYTNIALRVLFEESTAISNDPALPTIIPVTGLDEAQHDH